MRVPFADQGLNKIPDEVTERQALFVGDVLATGYWATRISEIIEDDTVLIIGAGPTGICTLLCVMLKSPKHIIMCEKDEERIQFINKHYPDVLTVSPEECEEFVKKQVIMVEQMLFLKLPELNQRFALHGSAQDRMQL